MKNVVSMGVCALVFSLGLPSAMAQATSNEVIRNDHISVSRAKLDYDINPLADSKRIVRNDHIVYSNAPKTEKITVKKHRFMRNDHVIVSK